MEWKIAVSISRTARAEAAAAAAIQPLFQGMWKVCDRQCDPKTWSKAVCQPWGGCLRGGTGISRRLPAPQQRPASARDVQREEMEQNLAAPANPRIS